MLVDIDNARHVRREVALMTVTEVVGRIISAEEKVGKLEWIVGAAYQDALSRRRQVARLKNLYADLYSSIEKECPKACKHHEEAQCGRKWGLPDCFYTKALSIEEAEYSPSPSKR